MLNIDIENLEYTVRPIIKNNKKNLENAKANLSSIIIPKDFSYAGRLKNLHKYIVDIETNINKIEKWIEDSIRNFRVIENKNRNIVNSVVNAASNISMSKIGANVASSKSVKVETKIEKIKDFVKKAEEGINLVGAQIADKCKNIYKDYLEPGMKKAWEGVKAVIADRANIVISLVKGLSQFTESLGDLVYILGTGGASVFTGIEDGVTYLYSMATGKTDTWESETAKMWKETMAFVAKDHVGNAFESFYKNNFIGKWLDENAHDWFKSDGAVSKVLEGLGYVGGIVLLSLATLGVGGAATGGTAGATTAATSTMTTTSSIISGLSGAGKYTAEHWAKVRDSSWEGIEEMYKNGEMSREEYNSLKQIRDLSDEEWKAFVAEYKNGNISKKDYEKIKQIREMPEDWTTFENGTKGILYGAANGLWEGLQWYAGGKLGDWTAKSGSKFVTSAVRVGTDTGFNALDTPFRAIIVAVTTDQNWKEAWKNQGGWKSLLTSVGVGLIGSMGGEVFDGKGISKNKNNNVDNIVEPGLNETSIFESIKNKFKKVTQQETNGGIDWRKFNTSDIDFSEWANARNAYTNFYENNKEFFKNRGITLENLEANFNNVMMCSDKDYLNCIKEYLGHNTSCTAFNYNGIVFAPSDICAKDIAHEVTHSWGNLWCDETGAFNRNYNSISEALTETIACSMGLDPKTTVSYTCNTKNILKISQILDSKGYKNAFLDAYVTSDSIKIKNIIDGIAGTGYYDELAEYFMKTQTAFINAYGNCDWATYYKLQEELDIFLNKLTRNEPTKELLKEELEYLNAELDIEDLSTQERQEILNRIAQIIDKGEFNMEELIKELAKDFRSSISDEESGEKLEAEFINVLKEIEKSFENNNYKESRIREILRQITNEWTNLDVEEKQRRLSSDNNFTNIVKISQQAYEMAISILAGKKINLEFQIPQKIEELENMLEKVKTCNKEKAKKLVSEGILDLKFLENPNSDITSLRLGHIKYNEEER